ncbi:universal stress protein, partial [Streptosporangium algeriense]
MTDFPARGTRDVVVAADGSAGAKDAVEWAVDDAFRRNAPLRIVHVVERGPYDIPRFSTLEWPGPLVLNGRRVLDEAERAARGRRPSVEVSTELIEGDPIRSLTEQAAGAVEVVLGSRGLGGFTGALLGSVSTRVAVH